MFGLSSQGVEGDDVIGAGGVSVDQPVAGIGIANDTSGAKQPERVICQERVRGDQAAAAASSDVLIEAMLQELGFVPARHTYEVRMSSAGGCSHRNKGREWESPQTYQVTSRRL
jgi:hypothetical protein